MPNNKKAGAEDDFHHVSAKLLDLTQGHIYKSIRNLNSLFRCLEYVKSTVVIGFIQCRQHRGIFLFCSMQKRREMAWMTF